MEQAEGKNLQAEKYQFLSGGGEMGILIRKKDWSKTSLGDPQDWPQSLRTMVSIMLDNPFGMYIAWGHDYIQLYNDGYRPILGSTKHPQALGISTKETFAEIWHIIGDMFDDVMKGNAVGFPDFMLPLNRNGFIEECYFDFSYSPIRMENGEVGGVLVIVKETTNKKKAEEDLKLNKDELEFAIEAAKLATWDYNPATNKFTSNKRLKEWFGLPAETDIELHHAINAIAERDRQRIADAIQHTLDYTSGGHYEAEYSIVQPDTTEMIVQAKGRAWFNSEKIAYRVNGTLEDVTERVMARRKLEESEERANIVIDASNLGTLELNLKTKAVVYSNRCLEIMGHTKGKILTHAELIKRLHPDDLNIREKAFKEAFKTGTLHYQSRVIWLDKSIHWIEGRGKVFYDEKGTPAKMIGTVRDITDSQLREESMARMGAIVQSSSDAIISKDLNGIITSWNPAAEQIFGYTEEEMIGQPVIRLIPPDRINEETNILQRLRNGEQVDHFETKRITKDNIMLDISLTISPIWGTNGNIIGASKIARNITTQKEAERLIASNEQKFQLLADSMPQFVWTGDAAGNLRYFNQAVYNYSGLSREQIDKESWLQIVHPDDRESNIAAWTHAVETGSDFIFEHRFGRYDGEYRWQLSRAIPQRDAAGNIQMWVGTSTDIQEIKEQDQQKDFFISMASHELKTPITSIKGYVQLLQNAYAGSEDDLLKKSLKVIDKQIITLTSLISDLLDVSKIKTGNLVLNRQPFEMSEMISEVANHIQQVSPGYSIVAITEPAFVYADRERISQVLINLLTNAVKYSPKSREIIIKNFTEQDNVVVSVQDSGIGINKADHEKIFERFYRVEGKDEKTYPGFGIGLFISSEIIQRHQGKIAVTSEPGKGSVFSFSIPQKNNR